MNMFNALQNYDSDDSSSGGDGRSWSNEVKNTEADIIESLKNASLQQSVLHDEESFTEAPGRKRRKWDDHVLRLDDELFQQEPEEDVLRNVQRWGQVMAKASPSAVNKVNTAPFMLRKREPNFRIKKKFPDPNPFANVHKSIKAFEMLGAAPPGPETVIIGRGLMMAIMRSFEPNIDSNHLVKDISAKVRLLESGAIHIFDSELDGWDKSPSYGHGFEHAMVTRSSTQGTHFFRCLRYNLANFEVQVCVEVDCVTGENEESVEIKTHSAAWEPKLLDYWYQMVLGDTSHLVCGTIDHPTGAVIDIMKKNVTDITPPDSRVRLSQLASTIQWIRREVLSAQLSDSQLARFEYTKSSPWKFLLKLPIA
mmetsp:Transcript_23750/g.35064  ORF Transcript_23750/g.35064 Transcript_23750/m.35064 type:complete len:366 (-) Transcript_23750:120-1217(-)|eukprot:CAMPEP_0194222472 /NCGR_PEP_ID=MMETSP0156-20130528/33006_1 /TAXON_ID=33649 /ORGANISM="Thalassionema nitzschioides, Strain L26-B" /LENGTH=365 /DNA_ID=CAMNT_0038953261 /DNA_START=171 /DNA_END=1268 /DNA_ORIENTATION=+